MYRYNRIVRMVQGLAFTERDEARSRYLRFEYAEPVLLSDIAHKVGFDYAVWALRGVEGSERNARLFAVWCARQVERLMIFERSAVTLGVAERFANGLTRPEVFAAARKEAEDAVRAQLAADPTNRAAFSAARCAADTANDDPWQATTSATAAAATALMKAAPQHEADAAWEAARAAQLDMFLKMCDGGAPWQAA